MNSYQIKSRREARKPGLLTRPFPLPLLIHQLPSSTEHLELLAATQTRARCHLKMRSHHAVCWVSGVYKLPQSRKWFARGQIHLCRCIDKNCVYNGVTPLPISACEVLLLLFDTISCYILPVKFYHQEFWRFITTLSILLVLSQSVWNVLLLSY